MSLESGQLLSRYRLVEQIGEGGMGVVWKAVDAALDRETAIKVLPDQLAADPEHLIRFEREVRLLASLSHPGIAAVYGLEESGGVRFLAMEIVHGETLHDCLLRGPIPTEEALPLACQIAEAIEAAHAAGVLHRDLKPANVMLTPEGKVKVLDFGLAKAFDAGAASGDAPQLATPAYMSPEQARAQPLDKRSDVWAYGCVVYEMLTGTSAFGAETVPDSIAKVLTGEPDWFALPGDCPATVGRLIRRCLQRDLANRLHDVADARIVLQETMDDPDAPIVDERLEPAKSERRPRPWLYPVLGLVALAGVAVGATLMLRTSAANRIVGTTHLTLETTADAALRANVPDPGSIALSPDGSRLVYRGSGVDGEFALFFRRFDSRELRRLDGTEGGYFPFFSPDGRWIGFIADGELRKIPVEGGRPQTLTAQAALYGGATWIDDQIVFSRSYNEALSVVSAGSGEPLPLTVLDEEQRDFGHWWPARLPETDTVLFSRWKTTVQDCSIWAVRADGSEQLVLEEACHPVYADTGHLLYLRAGTVMAVRFDPRTLKTSGASAVVLDDVLFDPDNGRFVLSVAQNGTLAYLARDKFELKSRLVWVDGQGRIDSLLDEVRAYRGVHLSPDGKSVALTIRGRAGDDIWVHDVGRGVTRRFTVDGTNEEPRWSADGREIVFSSLRQGPYALYRKPVDESRDEEVFSSVPTDQGAGSWSPAGVVAVVRSDPETRSDVWMLSAEDGSATPWLSTRFDEESPRFSPDGAWVAYQSDSSGREEVYLQAYQGREGRWQVSVRGGVDPLWSPDGKALHFWNERKLFRVSVDTSAGVQIGAPVVVLDEARLGGDVVAVDIHPDGSKFAVVLAERRPGPQSVQIALDWFTELERLVP